MAGRIMAARIAKVAIRARSSVKVKASGGLFRNDFINHSRLSEIL
jgi:hypothetical protein